MALERLSRCPTSFLSRQSESCVNNLLATLKSQYDDLKSFESKKNKNRSANNNNGKTLSCLLVDGFDAEQIWQQLEIQNKVFRRQFHRNTERYDFTSKSPGGSLKSLAETSSAIEEEAEEGIPDEEEEVEGEEESEDDQEHEEEEDGDEDSEGKSAFERQQEKLRKRIEEYEEQILTEKPWQLKGEVTANRRPENSLLEEHVSYEHATKLPPVITQETTETLESLITQRIRDQAWDDVERKIKPTDTPYVYKNELVLDQEKPKMSLSQIYEEEFLKKASVTEEEKKNPKHEEIRKSMKELFFKLDLLTSYRYTPKPMIPEVKVVNNMPSIRMEEVAPVSISDGALLAPEEVKEKRKGEMKAKEERSKVDKNRELRIKKKMQKLKAARREQRQKNDQGQKMVAAKTPRDKMKLLKKIGRVRRPATKGSSPENAPGRSTSSKDFFARLQARVKETVAESGKSGGKKKNSRNNGDSTKKHGAAFKT